MDPVDQIKEEIVERDKSRFLTFLVFLVISTLLWFIIKLTKDYTTQATFRILYTEVPVNKWVPSQGQTVKLTFVADGFVTLNAQVIRKKNLAVEVPLEEITYRLEGGSTYSYNSQYIAEKVSEMLSIPVGNIIVSDDKQYFNMEDLQSKELAVNVPMDVNTLRQYEVYGTPVVNPSTITVYGPKNLLDTLTAVYTQPLRAVNASETFVSTLPIDFLDGAIRSSVETVEVKVTVEKYTEMDLEVPVDVTDTLHIRFFPENLRIKCMVAIKDYANIKGSSFRALADTAQLHQLRPLLDVRVVMSPPNVRILKVEPEQVEYLILNNYE